MAEECCGVAWVVSGWRGEALLRLLFYGFAVVLLVVLPLHLLEHVPVGGLRQPPRGWVLYLLLVAAGVHGGLGVRSMLYDYVHGRVGRRVVDVAVLVLSGLVVAVGLSGLLRVFPLG